MKTIVWMALALLVSLPAAAGVANVAAMQTKAGWGAGYADDIRNGDWEYTMFNADGTFNEKADIKSCFNCHKPHDKQNFVMSWAQLSGTAS